MRLGEYKNRIGSVALTLALLIGFGMAVGATAQAQYRDYDYDRYGRYDDRVRWDRDRTRQYALLLGYHTGYGDGNRSRDDGYRVDHDDMPNYRNGTNGWRAWMGHEDTYRDNYRRGYETGFKEARNGRSRRYDKRDVERVLGDRLENVYGDDYDDRRGGWGRRDRRDRDYDNYPGYGRYDRNQVYRIAQQNGYQEGFRAGQDDRSRRRSYELERESAYRDGLRGYRSEYGDRRIYQQAYRDGFRRGYDEGYNRGRWNNGGNRFPWPF